MAVAFNECAFGGAAKANRWAALNPKCPCRTTVMLGVLHVDSRSKNTNVLFAFFVFMHYYEHIAKGK